MAFRDDRDALLARADALERENARLRERGDVAEAELAAARDELDEVRAELERLGARAADEAPATEPAVPAEPVPAAPERRAHAAARIGQSRRALRGPRQVLAGRPAVVVGLIAGAVALGIVVARVDCPGRRRGSAAPHVDAGLDRRGAAAPADAGVDQDAAAQLDEARACLDRGDLYVHAFLAAPAPRPSHLLADVEACRRLDRVTLRPLREPAAAYLAALAALEPHLRREFAYYVSGLDREDPAQAATLASARAGAAAAWRGASSRLRDAARAPTRAARDEAAQRAARDGRPDQAVVVAFGDATAAVLELAAADKPDAAALALAIAELRRVRREAGEHATGYMGELISAAERVRAAVEAGEPMQFGDALRDLTFGYNAAHLGRPSPR